MPSLADSQAWIRRAIVDGETAAVLPFLVGGADPARRLTIYQRHYDASLAKQMLGRFPTVVWLIGSAFVTRAAHAFVRLCPPAVPCLAEYGEGFPTFLAGLPGAERAPYLRSVGEIDWCLGDVAVAIEYPAIEMARLAGYDAETLLDLRLSLQPGVRHVEAPWPADELVKLHLSEQVPDRYVLDPLDVHLEIRGARGAFRISRLDRGVFSFRRALAEGVAIGIAVERVQQTDPTFDAASALTSLFADGLVRSVAGADRRDGG